MIFRFGKDSFQYITTDELKQFYKSHSKVTNPKFPYEGWMLVVILILCLILEYLIHV